MTADKVQTFLLKGKKQRPETAKPKRPQDLETNQVQDDSIDLQKILSYYRARVEAQEQDRFLYQHKLEMLRIKQAEAHQIQWEYKKRTEERQELVEAVQQCEAALGNERGTIQEMSFGGEALKVK